MDVPAAGVTQGEVTQDFSSTFLLLRPLPQFLARRIQPFLSLVDREVEFLCTNEMIVLHLLGIFIIFFIIIYLFIYYFFCEESPSSCDYTGIRTHVPTSEGFRS